MHTYREIPNNTPLITSHNWIKGHPSGDPTIHEYGDIATMVIQGEYITGMYLGNGDIMLKTSFMIIDSYALVM